MFSFVKIGNQLVNLAFVRKFVVNKDGTGEAHLHGESKVLPATVDEAKAIVAAITATKPVVGLKETVEPKK